jgi:hypothetical protein
MSGIDRSPCGFGTGSFWKIWGFEDWERVVLTCFLEVLLVTANYKKKEIISKVLCSFIL